MRGAAKCIKSEEHAVLQRNWYCGGANLTLMFIVKPVPEYETFHL